MKALVISVFLVYLGTFSVHAETDRYKEMQRWLKAHEAEQQQQAREQARKQKQEEQKAQNCARAKDQAERYRNAGGLYEFDDKGERQYLDKQQRKAAQASADAEVEKWCN